MATNTATDTRNFTPPSSSAKEPWKEQARDKVSDIGERTSQTAREAKEQVREKASEMSQSVKDLTHLISQTVQETLRNLRHGASEYYQKGMNKAQNLEQSFEERVHRRPMVSIVIAAAVGILLGMLMRGGEEEED